jgi:hypothetical protein
VLNKENIFRMPNIAWAFLFLIEGLLMKKLSVGLLKTDRGHETTAI